MDTSTDSLSDAESSSSWILVNDGMCIDNSDKTLITNNHQENEKGVNEKDVGPAGSGHESDTSDGISIISEFDSDHERNGRNEIHPEKEEEEEENSSDRGCEEAEERNKESEEKSCEELDRNDMVQTIQSQIVEEKGTKHLKIPHIVTISIFGAVFAVSSVFILQLINSRDIQDAGHNEFVPDYMNIAILKDVSNKIMEEESDVVEYCAVKHESNDLHKEHNERKCIDAYINKLKKRKSNLRQDKRMQQQTFKGDNRHIVQSSRTQIKNNVPENVNIENYTVKKRKDNLNYKKKQNEKKHNKRLQNNENVRANDRPLDEQIQLQKTKKKFLTAKYILAKEEYLTAKENYLKNKERYLRNMAVIVEDKWQRKKEKRRKLGNGNSTRFEKNKKGDKMEIKSNKWDTKNKEKGGNLDKNFTKPNKYNKSTDKENSYRYKYLAPSLYKHKRNNSISWELYRSLYNGRSQIRKREHQSDWIFDRAQMRNRKRDKAQWYFQWMADREQFRYKRGYRFASN